MTRRFVSVPIALLCLLSHAAADARTLNADHYRDRLAGMWMGQILGNYAGRPYEGDCQRGGLTDVLDWDSASSFTRTDPWEGDDDTLFEYMYADLLAENASPSGSDVKAQWEQHMKVPAFYIANRQARYLMNQGYTPPQTGSHERNVYWFAIDSQITTESVGAMAPGMRQRASDLTGTLGGATNEGYALQAAQFYAAMYAAAPFGSDVEQLVQDGLAVVPAGSRTHQVITDTWDLYTADKADGTLDWRATQTSLFDNYGLRDDTGRYRGWVESTVNTAMTTLAVLYGQGDFKQTVEIGALAGFDADCNPATAGGLVGLMQGYDAILAAVPNATATDYEIPTLINYDSVTTVDAVAGLLQQAAEGQILAAGGTISGTGDQRTYTLPDDVVTSPGAIVYPDGPGGLVGAVKAAGGTVGVSASVERHQAADRGNLGQIMDGIIDVTQNGHVPYWTNDGNNPQPAGGDWYQVEFDRTVTFTALTFHEGDALLVKSWDKPVIEKLRGGYFEDLIVEVLQDGQYVQVELLSQSEPLEALKAFQHIELAFNPVTGEAIRIRGTAGGQDEFTTIVELEVDGLIGEILAGDLDADGDVDFDDAELFRAAWLASPPSPSWYDGDFDGDGDVDFADAWAMLDNFRLSQSPLPRGAMGAYLTGEAVPEPTALVLLTMGATSFLAARSRSPRRRRSAR